MSLKLSPSQCVFNIIVEYGICFHSKKIVTVAKKKKRHNLHVMQRKLIKKRLAMQSEIIPLASDMCIKKHSLPKENRTALSAISDFLATTTLIP